MKGKKDKLGIGFVLLAVLVVTLGLSFLEGSMLTGKTVSNETLGGQGLLVVGSENEGGGGLVTQTERPVRGWIKYTNGTAVNGATVVLRVKLYAHLAPSFWCYCESPNTTSSATGEWVENLNNLDYTSACTITGKNPGDYCGNDWQDNSYIWMNYSGTTATPPVIDGSTTPLNISDAPLIAGITYLENITIDSINPNVTLVAPVDNYVNDSSDSVNVTFTCNATDDIALENISLYITNNLNTSFALNQTTAVGGVANSSGWVLGLSKGNYTWNCLAYDSFGNSDWGDTNRTILVNYSAAVQQCSITGLVNDALGNNVSSVVQLYNAAGGLVGSDDENYNFSVPCDNTGNYAYSLKVIPATSNFNALVMNNLTLTTNLSDLIDLETSPVDTEGPAYFTNWTEIIAWNPNPALNYSSITINMSYNDTGLAFYKCAAWNYTERNCTDDNWTYVEDLLDGAHDYVRTFAPGDPAGGAGKKPIVEAYLNVYEVSSLGETGRRDNGTFLGRFDNLSTVNFNYSSAYRVEIFLNNTNAGSKAVIYDPYQDNIPEELVLDMNGTDAPNITVVSGSVIVNSFTAVNSTGTETGTKRLTWDASSPNRVIEDLNYGELVKLWYVVDFNLAQASLNNATFFGDVKGSNGDAYLVNPFNTSLDAVPPNVTLNSPASPYVNDSAALINVTFNCSATDDVALANISLYITNSANSSFALNQTTAIGGKANESIWTLELGAGNYTWNCLAYDAAGNNDWGDQNRSVVLNWTSPIDNLPNSILSLPPDNYVNDSSDPVNITFVCNATDDIALENISLYITNYLNTSFALNQTTAVGGVANSSSWVLGLSKGNYTWNCLACDNSSQCDWGDNNRSVLINYSAPLVDNPPYWLNNMSNIVSVYSPMLSYFNISWLDDYGVSSIWFESNYSGSAQNYSMNLIAGNLTNGTYNYSAILPAGSHYWKSFANDTIDQWNFSDTWYFTIAQANSTCSLVFDPTSPQTYGTLVNASCSCTNGTPATLFRDGVEVTGTENNQDALLGVGNYSYVCNSSDTVNYSVTPNSSNYIVNQAAGVIYLYLNGSRANFSTPDDTNVNISAVLINGTGDILVYNNGALIYNGSSPSENTTLFNNLGMYNITAVYPGNQNYTTDSETWWLNVTVVPNNLPTAPVVEVTPDNATTVDDLLCNLTTLSTDADNDTINYYFNWYNGSTFVLVFGPTTSTSHLLGSGNTSRGENWNCTVVPWDGHDNGTASSDNVTILNSPPVLVLLPNQSWIWNTNKTAFDLDDYFSDPDGDNLSYTYTNATNITTVVNVNNSVTFVPETNFTGTNYIFFYANDSFVVTTSNKVTLHVYKCGDGTCDASESCSTCPSDCGSCPPINPPSSCFPAGTKILMADGTEKMIEEVAVGDWVKSYDFEKGELAVANVLELESPVREGYYMINELLNVTDEHPLYTLKNNGIIGWSAVNQIAAEKDLEESELRDEPVYDLEVGDKLYGVDGEWIGIESISYVPGEVQTYNLKTVDRYNVFFANGVLVHNKDGGGCVDTCEGGEERRCKDATTVEIRDCGDYDADICDEWSSWKEIKCPVGETCLNGYCSGELIKDKAIDLTLISYPEEINVGEDFVVFAEVKNTGKLLLENVSVVSDPANGWRGEEVLLGDLEVGEKKVVEVIFKNRLCVEDGFVIPESFSEELEAKEKDVSDAENLSMSVIVPELSVLTDRHDYVENELMRVCIVYNNLGEEDKTELEFECNVKQEEYYIIDYLSPYDAGAGEILVVVREYLLDDIPETGNYTVEAMLYEKGELFSEKYLLKQAEKEVFLNGFVEERLLQGENTLYDFMYNDEGHTVKINSFDDDYVELTVYSAPQNFKIGLLESVLVDLDEDGQNDISLTYLGVLDGKADVRLRLLPRTVDAPLVGSAYYQILGVERGDPVEMPKFSLGGITWKAVIIGVIILFAVVVFAVFEYYFPHSHHWYFKRGRFELKRKSKRKHSPSKIYEYRRMK